MKVKNATNTPRFVMVPGNSISLKEEVRPEVLKFCLANPRNSYPLISSRHQLHIISESDVNQEVIADISAIEKKLFHPGAEHVLYVISEQEYSELKEETQKQTESIITKVIASRISAQQLSSIPVNKIIRLINEPFVNPRTNAEIEHFVLESVWNHGMVESLKLYDKERDVKGVIIHHVAIIKDQDYDRIIKKIR